MLYNKIRRRKMKLAHVMAVWFIAIICLGALVIGRAESPDDEGNVDEMTTIEVAAAGTTAGDVEVIPSGTQGQAIQSIHLKKDMPITDALRSLGLQYQKNIVPTAGVTGTITVTNLYDVTFEEALEAIIGANKYEIQGNFIKVYTPEEFATLRKKVYKEFTLYYLTAEEAKKLVTALLGDDESVATSSPAATGVPASESISTSGSGGDNLATQDILVVHAYPDTVKNVAEVLDRLDKRPQQVLVEATILSATLTEAFDLGVDLNFAGGISLTGTAATSDLVSGNTVSRGTAGSTPMSQIANWNQDTPIEVSGFAKIQNGLRIGITAGDINVFITALEQITDVTVLANPKILAINKQLGQVYIGTKLGYREGDVITDGGATQEGSVKFLDTGTKLAFRPYIGNDGYIRMDIHPKDSSGSLNSQGVPDEVSAELATNVMVKDGQTVVIGGLFRDVIQSVKSQVPLLGDIPGIGELFKSTEDTTIRQEVIVLLTPHIIEETDELESEKRIADVQRKRASSIERLHWMGVDRRAEESYAKAAELYSNGDSRAALCELNNTLRLRPTYLEAIRLRERIVQYNGGAGEDVIERIMIDAIQDEETARWHRF